MNTTSNEKRQAQRNISMNRLKAFWEEFQKMDDHKKAIVTERASKLGNYSDRNKVLIYFQAMARGFVPSAVMPFRAWKEIGRRVKKGEKGLQILVPLIYKGKDTPKPEDGVMVLSGHDFSTDDGSRKENVWFKIGYVFDLSQTEKINDGSEALPE